MSQLCETVDIHMFGRLINWSHYRLSPTRVAEGFIERWWYRQGTKLYTKSGACAPRNGLSGAFGV